MSDVITSRLDRVGEPPAAFVRCWLLDKAAGFSRFAIQDADENLQVYAREVLHGARLMWRKYVAPSQEGRVA